jgi:hypothetical protein
MLTVLTREPISSLPRQTCNSCPYCLPRTWNPEPSTPARSFDRAGVFACYYICGLYYHFDQPTKGHDINSARPSAHALSGRNFPCLPCRVKHALNAALPTGRSSCQAVPNKPDWPCLRIRPKAETAL